LGPRTLPGEGRTSTKVEGNHTTISGSATSHGIEENRPFLDRKKHLLLGPDKILGWRETGKKPILGERLDPDGESEQNKTGQEGTGYGWKVEEEGLASLRAPAEKGVSQKLLAAA